MGLVLYEPIKNRKRRESMNAVLLAIVVGLACSWVSIALGQACPPGATCPYAPSTMVPSVPRQSARPQVVRITAQLRDGVGYGSGAHFATVGDRSYVVTCWHVVDGAQRIIVTAPNGQPYEARLIATDRPHDLAALMVARLPAAPLQLREASLTGSLTVAGYGSGAYRESTGGVLGYRRVANQAAQCVVISAAVRQGDSGGPVLDQSGRLAAIVWGAEGPRSYATFGAPLRRLLARLMPRVSRQPASDERDLAPVAKAPRDAKASPATCDCGPRWPKFNDQLSQISERLTEIEGTANAIQEDRQSLIKRAIAAAKKAAADATKQAVAATVTRGGAAWGAVGAVAAGGPLGLAAIWGMRRIAQRIERRVSERLEDPRQRQTFHEDAKGVQERIDARQGDRFRSQQASDKEVRGPVPRDDTEARQLLQLGRLEGHDPIQQALVGQLALSRLDHIAESDADETRRQWSRDLASELRQRFNEISPAVYKPFEG